jgi:hypothetical protein
MRATALVTAMMLGALTLAPLIARAQAMPGTAYAADNGGGPAGPNDIALSIPVTAHVGSVCSVVTGGGVGGADFGATVQLGDLADQNGHQVGALSASTSAAASVVRQFQVDCTGANDAISITATPVAIAPAPPPAPGRASSVDYTAEVDFTTTGAANSVAMSHEADGTLALGSLGSGVSLANTANDVTIKAYNFRTANTATDVLVASPSYVGVITVTISAGV